MLAAIMLHGQNNPTLAREDDQFDVKVDHNATTNNRFFARYSFQQTHRNLPATLPFDELVHSRSASSWATSRVESISSKVTTRGRPSRSASTYSDWPS